MCICQLALRKGLEGILSITKEPDEEKREEVASETKEKMNKECWNQFLI